MAFSHFHVEREENGGRSTTTIQLLCSFTLLYDVLLQILHASDCNITYVLDQNRSDFWEANHWKKL